MNNKLLILLITACAAFAQTPDVFTGTWKLNAQKTTGGYRGGTRSYHPVAGGTHVTYSMTRADGTDTTGEYTVQCKAGKCTSNQANWTHKNTRTVVGQAFENGAPAERYVRTVSADGRTMTITFYPPTGKKKPLHVQVWEKQ